MVLGKIGYKYLKPRRDPGLNNLNLSDLQGFNISGIINLAKLSLVKLEIL